jgi:hypothetical protein
MLQRRLVLWLFPLALLLGQVGGFAHGLTHAQPGGPDKERIAGTILCDQCASFAKLAHVVADAPQMPAVAAAVAVVQDEPVHGRAARVEVPYRSRAPPVLF